MTRKIFIMFFAAATSYCAIPSGLYAEAASPISRIGILIPESAPGESQTIKGLKDGLKDLGYIEGNNLVVELRDAKGDRSALKTGAADLVSKKVDVIFTTGSRATEAAKAATRQIPIVFRDRKSTRLNFSHPSISYAVFCLKKKNATRSRASIPSQWHPKPRPRPSSITQSPPVPTA